MEIVLWPVAKFVSYSRSLRKNRLAVDRMKASIQQSASKFPS
jgi:hypothetical protein